VGVGGCRCLQHCQAWEARAAAMLKLGQQAMFAPPPARPAPAVCLCAWPQPSQGGSTRVCTCALTSSIIKGGGSCCAASLISGLISYVPTPRLHAWQQLWGLTWVPTPRLHAWQQMCGLIWVPTPRLHARARPQVCPAASSSRPSTWPPWSAAAK